MAQPQSPVLGIEQLIQQARFHPAGALPTETHQSFPIPVFEKDTLRVLFMYCPSSVSAEGLFLSAPSYVAYLDAKTGAFLSMKKVIPRDLGRSDPPHAVLGQYAIPEGMTSAEFAAQQRQMLAHYDVLLPLFALRETRVSPETRRIASEFRQLFVLVAESPLEPYYSEVGQDFFRWLDTLIR